MSLDRAGGTAADVRRSFVPLAAQRTPESRTSPHQAMVRILFGCNQFCAYCVVPSVRGPEQSRPAAEILEEVRRLANGGTVEVTLLGQTVNSYRDSTGPKAVLLADLLALVNDVAGIRRIKFVTNHPLFMSDELLQAVRDLPKVSPYLHVPAQSGSEAVLRRMKRGYTADLLPRNARADSQVIPQAAVTSDFIVGFCGETEVEFLQTVDLVRDARFKTASSSSTALGPAPLPPGTIRTTCPRRSSAVGTTSCWPCRTPSASRTTGHSWAKPWRSSSKGPAKWPGGGGVRGQG